jgi:hypothetical protein
MFAVLLGGHLADGLTAVVAGALAATPTPAASTCARSAES